jgi:MFS family permease
MVSPAVRRITIAHDPRDLGANLGRQMAFDVSGIVIGPVVAALLASLFGLRVPFGVLAALYLGLLAVTWALDLRVDTAPPGRRRTRTRALLRIPAMQAALSASVAFYVTVGTMESLWAILLADFGAETWLVGVTLSFFAIPAVLIAPFSGRLAQRRGPMRIVISSLLVATLCTAAYGFVPLWLAVAVSALNAVADAFTMPGNQVAVAMTSPPEQIAAGQGLLGAVGLAAAGLAALGGGFVYEHSGRATVFVGAAGVMLVFIALARFRGRILMGPPPDQRSEMAAAELA